MRNRIDVTLLGSPVGEEFSANISDHYQLSIVRKLVVTDL